MMKSADPLRLLLLVGCSAISGIHCWSAIPRSLASSTHHHHHTSQTHVNPNYLHSGSPLHESSSSDATAISDTPSTTSASSPSDDDSTIPYDWKKQWYAVTFASHVPNPSESAEVTPVSIFGEPMVLWRSEDNGQIHCAEDVCPHRSAALSEGRLRDGKLECYYHGWQFDGQNNGECNFIPQLQEDTQKIPKQACLKMKTCRVVEGIVWVWMDAKNEPTINPPTQGDDMEHIDPMTGKHDKWIVNDFQIDLPYDHSYLVENLIDPAHIPISHDATPGGGKRENAQAYEMIVDGGSMNTSGFTGRYRTVTQRDNNDPFIEVTYEAPGIIRQRGMPRGKDSPLRFGAALHCMPLTLGRSRLLFRTYFTGLPPLLKFIITSKPKFLQNLNSCKILEQDAGLITTQEDYFKRTQHALKDDYILLSTSDVFVKAYRQWLDKVGHGMPWFQGLAKRSNNVDDHLADIPVLPPNLDSIYHRAGNHIETRYHRHVMHCPATKRALRRVQLLKKCMMTAAVASITLSCGMATSNQLFSKKIVRNMMKLLVPLIPLSSLAAAGLHKLEKRFFVSFKRKNQMSTESGL